MEFGSNIDAGGSKSAKYSGGSASNERDDEELSIPRAALNKMIKELAPNVRVANDARELILNCCTEFIHLISSEANELCNKQQKKTISPEHVLEGQFLSVTHTSLPFILKKSAFFQDKLGLEMS